jgi:hypothetical protein
MSRIGLITEDLSDAEVVIELTGKIVSTRKITFKTFSAKGCGKIIGKCVQWAQVLKDQGCTAVILVHDLDTKHLPELRTQLGQAFKGCPIKHNVIIIPVREIEAWLLADETAIQKAMNLPEKVKYIANPEAIMDPKSKLGEIIYLRSKKKKRYLNTKHNQRIAAALTISNVKRCKSFLPLEQFLTKRFQA